MFNLGILYWGFSYRFFFVCIFIFIFLHGKLLGETLAVDMLMKNGWSMVNRCNLY